jgi:RNA methyltransferase, TrmH family
MPVITSSGNATIKSIRALRQRKERQRTGLFYAEGIRLVGEAVDLGVDIETCVVAPELLTSEYGRMTVERALERGIDCVEVSADVFRGLSLKEGPQGIAAVVRQHWEVLGETIPGNELCWIALAAVQDPGNLGTILRTSDAVGAAGVILIGDATDPYDPGAVRAGMGAVFSQRLVRASTEELHAWKQRHGAKVVGTSDAASLDYRDAAYARPLILLMGSEREGLGGGEMTLCDEIVRIPMEGRGDSLNLAVATGVMLFEIARQHRPSAGS